MAASILIAAGDPFTASSSCRARTCTPELRKSRKLRRQKYSRDGKLLLQIGVKGKVDSADGSVAIDPENGHVFVAHGYVSGKELSQLGRPRSHQLGGGWVASMCR